MKTYYLLDMKAADIDNILKQLQILHRATYPECNLSITYNNDYTQAIVKVVNATKIAGTLLTREEALDLLYKDSAWMEETKTDQQRIDAYQTMLITQEMLKNEKI